MSDGLIRFWLYTFCDEATSANQWRVANKSKLFIMQEVSFCEFHCLFLEMFLMLCCHIQIWRNNKMSIKYRIFGVGKTKSFNQWNMITIFRIIRRMSFMMMSFELLQEKCPSLLLIFLLFLKLWVYLLIVSKCMYSNHIFFKGKMKKQCMISILYSNYLMYFVKQL